MTALVDPHHHGHRRRHAREAGDRAAALRMLKAALMNKEVERGRDLDDAESLQVVNALVKQRRDSDRAVPGGQPAGPGRPGTAEIVVLERYLPPAASDEDIAGCDRRRSRRNRRHVGEGHGPRDESRAWPGWPDRP